MDIEALIDSVQIFDLLIVLGLFGMFVLGFVQGVIRRLIGIGSIVFAFIVAAYLREPVGNWLGSNWTQFPAEYSRMLAFGLAFGTIAVGLAVVTQINYKTQLLWPKTQFVEEIVGGLLGLVQGVILLLAIFVILETYFGGAPRPALDELPFLRSIYQAYDGSITADVYRTNVIPGFIALFGILLPESVKSLLQFGG